MKYSLVLPKPSIIDMGLTWQFAYRGYPARLIASETTLRLWLGDTEVDPSRVLRADELENDWNELSERHVLGLMLLAAPSGALERVLALNVERILYRYADILDGCAPSGYANQ